MSVVVPALNAARTIGRTLAALAAQRTDASYEVIVVDGGSSDGTAEVVRSADPAVELLHNAEIEPASSRNLGVRHARGDVVAFTDADCEPAPDWLAAGIDALRSADLVQGKVLPTRDPGPFDRTVTVLSEYGLYETANLFVKRAVFERVGEFEPVGNFAEERKFGEDVWFAWRAKRAGARTRFADDAIVRHEVFEGSMPTFLAEQARVRYFPALVARVPELRSRFLHRRVFLSKQSMRFDLAVLGLLMAAASRRRWPASLAAVPWTAAVALELRRTPPAIRPSAAAARITGDAVRLVALGYGSTRARSPVL